MKLSSDRKTSQLSKWEPGPKRWKPLIRNATGKLAGLQGSCPEATEWCAGDKGCCYAMSTERIYPSMLNLVTQNYNEILNASAHECSMIYRTVFREYASELEKVRKRFPDRKIPDIFRIGYDGDVMKEEEALGITLACRMTPQTQFWLYTRSFSLVHLMIGIPNLTLYLSIDKYNIERAKNIKDNLGKKVHLAFCADTIAETLELTQEFPNERKGPICPELTGAISLVNTDGVGACAACLLCTYGRNSVRFISNRSERKHGQHIK